MMRKAADPRSTRWFGHRSRMMQIGYGPDDRVGRPYFDFLRSNFGAPLAEPAIF